MRLELRLRRPPGPKGLSSRCVALGADRREHRAGPRGWTGSSGSARGRPDGRGVPFGRLPPFADREALLAEVSRFARNELAAEMHRRVNRTKDPRRRLRAVGTAYIDFALTEPGLFRTAFTSHPATSRDAEHDRATGGEDPTNTAAGAEPFEVLGQVLDEAQAARPLEPRRRPGAEIAAWSAVHGPAGQLLDGPIPTSAAAIKFSRGQVLDLVERGLLNGAQT